MKLYDTAQSNMYQFQFMRAEETRKIKTVEKARELRGEEVLVLVKTQMSGSLCSGRTFFNLISALDLIFSEKHWLSMYYLPNAIGSY